jgi:hypothetical protein
LIPESYTGTIHVRIAWKVHRLGNISDASPPAQFLNVYKILSRGGLNIYLNDPLDVLSGGLHDFVGGFASVLQ